MALTVQQIQHVAHLPLILGVLRRLEVATVIDRLIPPHPAHVLSAGRGVEALVLAILDGDHALYKVGRRLEERGMVALLQPALTRAALNDYRLGHILDALFAANLNTVFGAIVLKALEVYGIPTPWLHQDTTTIALYGAYEDAPKAVGTPRPAYGHSKDGRDDLKQVLLSLGVSGDGGIPLRLGVRDGNRSDSVETPLAIEECFALGLEGMRGIVADSKAYSRRTLGVCFERQVHLVTLVPRTCAVRQELEAWGQQQSALPLLVEKPGRTKDEAPRRWHGQSVIRQVEVEYSDGRVVAEALRFVVVHSSQLAHQQTQTYASGQAKEAEAVADHVTQVQARWFACQTQKPLWQRMRGRGRAGEAGAHAPGAITRSVIVSWPTPTACAVPVGADQPSWTHRPWRRAIALWWRRRGSPTRRRPMAGRCWRRPSARRPVRMWRYSRPIRSNTLAWNRAFAGSRIRRRSVPCGWRNPNGWPPWPC